ncbi:glycosyltransferase involved in cell wall biosynthesis [Nocardioides sp. BE266]|uniref:glycosyltransferase family 4 protein n=1 Tax=Nocardioides sp. BE266 TaxID=2817725 RepID=UPI0028615FD4|nr:glycosyltransferase [Nocardioides sp. BE266]MDR7252079.1 glycosyltransferase involved in cell wall biosynthesis [Nocardioides sp. BE266]
MKIAYAVPHPVTGAIRQRVLGLVRSIRAARPDVEVTVLAPAIDLPAESAGTVTFRRVEVIPDGADAKDKVARRVRLGTETVAELGRVRPDLVIIYGGGALYMGRIQSWARRVGCLVAADAVEWYDRSHLPGGRWGPFAIDNELMMRRSLLACDGVIAISQFLASFVSRQSSASVVVIPPLLDVQAIAWEAGRGALQRLAYCGTPGRKDDLGVFIAALSAVDPDGRSFELVVAGPSEDDLLRLPGVTSIPDSVRTVGRLSSEDSLALVTSATWAPLARPDKRFAHAGFPTKLVEALAAGTPPIANLTSDLGSYLKTGRNSLVMADSTLESAMVALDTARSLSEADIADMSGRARVTAEENFDFRAHAAHLDSWLGEMSSRGRA